MNLNTTLNKINTIYLKYTNTIGQYIFATLFCSVVYFALTKNEDMLITGIMLIPSAYIMVHMCSILPLEIAKKDKITFNGILWLVFGLTAYVISITSIILVLQNIDSHSSYLYYHYTTELISLVILYVFIGYLANAIWLLDHEVTTKR